MPGLMIEFGTSGKRKSGLSEEEELSLEDSVRAQMQQLVDEVISERVKKAFGKTDEAPEMDEEAEPAEMDEEMMKRKMRGLA